MLSKRYIILSVLLLLWSGLICSEYGTVAKSFIAQFLPEDPVIVEAGAHNGADTLELSKTWPHGTIHAFEPISRLFKRLKRAESVCDNVRAYQMALGQKTGAAVFHVSGGSSDGSSSLLAPKKVADYHPTVSFRSTIDVDVMTLDDWAEKYNVKRVDFMWLDMQGSELDMLKASPRMVATTSVIYTEVSLVELYDGCPLYDEVRSWLESKGFVVVKEEIPWQDGGNVLFVKKKNDTPKISIITSLYKGEKYIKGFLQDIVRQTIFDQCELIIINGNSPEHEDSVIQKYMKDYPNIIYKRLDYDPGIYGCWNLAIVLSRGKYLTNANVDDRLSPYCYEAHMKTLDKRTDIDLVYSNICVTNRPNETFACNSSYGLLRHGEFSPSAMYTCLPGCNPMWRRLFHGKYGLFDESYKSAGDWEMWCRAVEGGAKFLKIPGVYCLFYFNTKEGLSSGGHAKIAQQERARINARYGHLWHRT